MYPTTVVLSTLYSVELELVPTAIECSSCCDNLQEKQKKKQFQGTTVGTTTKEGTLRIHSKHLPAQGILTN